ncbi:hypothetical protein ACFRKE_11280 [Kitasatospora indigofera]|uniref:AbiJ-related protein n=1 Tax=Kitasatospora indigofera TaxID=67307 RepID=UPI00367F01E2
MLREAVTVVVRGLKGHTHRDLTELGAELGLPMPDADSGSKHERVEACLVALNDADLLPVAQRLLASQRTQVHGPERHGLEDAVRATGSVIEIPGRVRRELAAALDLGDLAHRQDRFERLLDQYWTLDNDPLAFFTGSSTTSRRALIHQHVFRNREDWSTEKLFEELGAFEAGSARFGHFLAGLVDPAALPDTEAQRRIISAVNPVLAGTGCRLEETGERDGYPFFELVRTGRGAPWHLKTLIFATTAKPDMRMVNVLDNDIEIMQDGTDLQLVYDRPVGPEGIRWGDLLRWWQETRGTGDEMADGEALAERLLKSMPTDARSPQRAVLPRLLQRLHQARLGRAGAAARSLAALGPQDREAAGREGTAEPPHGLPDPPAQRHPRDRGGRRTPALREHQDSRRRATGAVSPHGDVDRRPKRSSVRPV